MYFLFDGIEELCLELDANKIVLRGIITACWICEKSIYICGGISRYRPGLVRRNIDVCVPLVRYACMSIADR